MRIISRKTLISFWKKHPDSEQALKSWFDESQNANWNSASALKKMYKNASIITSKRVVFNIKENMDEYNELEILSILIDDYEKKKFPINLPDPIEAIKFRLEQSNLDRSTLISIIGSKSRTSEILNKKRKLSLSMIRAIHKRLNIPASSLISEY